MRLHLRKITPWTLLILLAPFAFACGGAQKTTSLTIRPLEEEKALQVIKDVTEKRKYKTEKDVTVALATGQKFNCDYRIAGERIAIEYLSQGDMAKLESIPAAAPGSRLHVVAAKTVPSEATLHAENIYLFFLDERNFQYQVNPTTDTRADVTEWEVTTRLKRDLSDFLSWYENKIRK